MKKLERTQWPSYGVFVEMSLGGSSPPLTKISVGSAKYPPYSTSLPTIDNVGWERFVGWIMIDIFPNQCNRLPITVLFGQFWGQLLRGRPPKTWLEYVRDDLSRLSKLHRILETYLDWWRLCRDRNEWTKKICKVVATHT
jgi:hypothetical protein